MTERLCPLEVTEALAAVPTRLGQESGLIVLTELLTPYRSLSIYIGQHEARAVQAGRLGQAKARPSTWDLYLSTLTAMGASLSQAVINRVEEERHFFAILEVRHGPERYVLNCRPSDAVALVVRSPGTALFATDDVLAAAGRAPAPAPAAPLPAEEE